MADFKLVGAVAIKVRPDTSKFKKETQAGIDKELAGVKAQVEVKADVKLDSTKAKAEAKAVEKELSGKTVTWNVKLDHDSVRAAQQRFDSMLEPTKKIKFDLNDQGSIDKAAAKLEKMARNAKVKITYAADEKGFNQVLAKIEEIRRQKLEETIKFKIDDVSLAEKEAEIIARMKAAGFQVPGTVRINYDDDRAGLEKAIATIDAELKKIDAVKIDVNLNRFELAIKKAELEAELGQLPVKIEYQDNLAGLLALKAKIESHLGIEPLHIETKLDEISLREQLAIVEAKIKEAEQNSLKIKPKISDADYAKAFAAIRLLAKNQTVGIFVKLNDASLLLAAAKLTGLRAASRWTEGFARSLGTLDRNLPIVAAAVVGISTLASGMLSLTASAFSLGNGLGEVVRMGGLLAPAMLLGLGAVMVVMKGVFKDFGAAVNGDTKAIKALSESGKKAAAEIRVVFQGIRETVSKNFWDTAGDAMLRFTRTALPAVGDGLKGLSVSLAGIFSGLLDSFSVLAKQDGVKVFFQNLNRGLGVAQTGMASFMSGFLTLAVVGSTVFPRIGHAFEAWATRFDNWTQRLATDGTLSRWTDRGIQGLKDLFNAGGSLVRVWGNIGQAAQASGALTLHSFAQMMARLDDITAGGRFQQNMTNIFKGARDASASFHKALGDLGPAMDVFSVTIKNTLSASGAALGAFVAVLGDIISSPRLNVGITAFLTGIKSMFESLRPAAAPVTEILQTFGQILGAVATDSGPLFRNLFQQLATVLTSAWHALEPFLPGLMQIGTTVINTLGPALSTAASSVIPAFAAAVQKIGDGLLPVIKGFSDFAVGVVQFLSGLQVPTLALMAGVLLSLGASFQFAGVVVPIAMAALEAFGIAAGITAIKVQLMVPVIGLALAALTGLALGGVAALATSMHSNTPFANEYEAALRKDAEAAGALAGAVGDATTKVALKKLVDSGAYDAAKKLGIGVQEVTDAVLKGGPALDTLRGKLSGMTTSTDESARAAEKAARKQGEWFRGSKDDAALQERKRLIDVLTGAVDDNSGSLEAGRHQTELTAEAEKAAGIGTQKHADAQKNLGEEMLKTSKLHGAAAAASQVLNDAFSSTTAKVDAMRKTFEILVGTDAKQQAAETLGAYAKGFNDLKDTVGPVAADMRKLGDAVYGENGFLNVGGGNKAVLQVNQALVDEVNNVWAGAKAAYDAALKHGDNVFVAFQKAQDFVAAHKGDYNQLAQASGVSADKVQGQWDAVFGHDWVLKVSLSGATEAAEAAQAMVTALKGNFDGKAFMAYLDANPAAALKAVTDAKGAAQDYVDHTWMATLTALPKPAQDALKSLTGATDAQWTNGDFAAILKVAAGVPGLAEALQAIRNGVAIDYQAVIFAAANGVSIAEARRELDALTATRTVRINAIINRETMPDLNGDASGNGRFGTGANGALLKAARNVDDMFKGRFPAKVNYYANGGIERQIAQITKPGGPIRVWSEPSTNGEAFIPYAKSKRPRSLAILTQVARDFGYTLSKSSEFANGGLNGNTSTAPARTSSTSVTVGTINTVDPESAVRKLRALQQDALAVAGLI